MIHHMPVWWLVYEKYLVIFRFELSNIYLWLTANRLSLNFDKTKYMIFHTSGCKMDDISLDKRVENDSIQRIREFNFLGLTINETMTWSSHVGKIPSKIGRTVGVLHKLKHPLPKDVLKTIYNSLIYPHFVSVSYPGDLGVPESINCRKRIFAH